MSCVEMGIGHRVRASRHRAGLSRDALAFRAGVSSSAIAQIESGRRANVRPTTLSALAGALGVTIDYLVSGSAPSRPMFDHRALLYATESDFYEVAIPFLEEAVERSEAIFVATRPERIRRLRRVLGPTAKRVEFIERTAFYTTPAKALEHYRAFMEGSLNGGATWIRALGEPVWTGPAEGDVRLWARFESLLNLLFSAAPVTMACPYDTSELTPEIIEQARATHPHTVEQAELRASGNYLDPSVFVLGGS
jgi:transcriptional regulator with XRE-family HTH domain